MNIRDKIHKVLLITGECRVSKLFPLVGVTEGATRDHLRQLVSIGMVSHRKEGGAAYYIAISPDIDKWTMLVSSHNQGLNVLPPIVRAL